MTYYDPSYGVKYANANAFQNAAVAALADETGANTDKYDLILPAAGDVLFDDNPPGN